MADLSAKVPWRDCPEYDNKLLFKNTAKNREAPVIILTWLRHADIYLRRNLYFSHISAKLNR
jgi:hypothetical protein